MQSGGYRQRVTLQSRVEATSAVAGPAGDEVATWADVGTYWAEVSPLAGRELYQAQQVKAGIDYKIEMRQVGPIAPLKNRFVYRGSMVLNPDSVLRVEERNAIYQILCTWIQGESP